jgi:hypothetical protein
MALPITIDIKSESVTKFIECVSKGIGRVYEPTAIIRKAKAEAEAGLILAQGDVAKRELIERAAQRLMHVETRRQENVESITGKALKELPENVSKEDVSSDWMAQFFENCQDVSEEEMQNLWAKLLAGEVARPGSFSRRTLHLLKTIDTRDAKAFTVYCSVCFTDSTHHFAFEQKASLDALKGRVRAVMPHLVSLGLLEAETRNFLVRQINGWLLNYSGNWYRLCVADPSVGVSSPTIVPLRFLTSVGQDLLKLGAPYKIPEFVESLTLELANFQISLRESEPPIIPPDQFEGV